MEGGRKGRRRSKPEKLREAIKTNLTILE